MSVHVCVCVCSYCIILCSNVLYAIAYRSGCVCTHIAHYITTCVYRYLRNVCFYCWLTQTHEHTRTHTQNSKIDDSNCTVRRSLSVVCVCVVRTNAVAIKKMGVALSLP